MVGEREVLVDGLDPERTGLARGRDRHGVPVEEQLARVGVEDARDDLDQGRLAGAVVPDDRVHLVRAQREVSGAQRDDPAESLLDVARLEQERRGHRPILRESGRMLITPSGRAPLGTR